jgi:hypothetical protein
MTLSITTLPWCYAECRFVECCYAECSYPECRGFELFLADWHLSEWHSTKMLFFQMPWSPRNYGRHFLTDWIGFVWKWCFCMSTSLSFFQLNWFIKIFNCSKWKHTSRENFNNIYIFIFIFFCLSRFWTEAQNKESLNWLYSVCWLL